MHKISFRRLGPLLALLLGAAGCSKTQTLGGLFAADTPHQAYARQLRSAGLGRSTAGRAWLNAADQALRDSLLVALPFAETGYFDPAHPRAAAYRYAVRAGEQVAVRLTLAPGAAARVFVDAFELRPGHPPGPLASADTAALSFEYRVEADGQHLLRVQPELLAAGRYQLSLRRLMGLNRFPVQGKTAEAIGSFWGAARDQGQRRHEGVDVFAPRGTPALAAAPGLVTRVGETALGGRVVWLADARHGDHLYYAHLDQQLVRPGQTVRPGDTLGLVGNTGNARTTAPHLHFGIYRAGQGAVDPLPFLRAPDPAPAPPPGPDWRGEWVRLRTAVPLVAALPVPARAGGPRLPRRTAVLVLGRQGASLRVRTAAGREGYVPAEATETAAPLRRLALPVAAEWRPRPSRQAAPVGAWPARTAVAVLAEAEGFALLRGPGGAVGWVMLGELG